MADPARGEIWMVDLSPVRGHEQGGRRPALVVSDDSFNAGPADLVIVLPITSRAKGVLFHVRIDPPEGNVKTSSYIKCEDIRSISQHRLVDRWSVVTPQTLAAVEDRMRILLRL